MHATRWAIVALICVYQQLQMAAAKNDFELHFENFTCKSDSSSKGNPLQSVHCGLSRNPKRRTLHMEFSLRELMHEHDFHIVVILPRRTMNFVLINVTTDGCQLLSNKNQIPLLRISRQMLDRYSNFPAQCPFERAKPYYLRGFRLDLSLIPAVMMETPVAVQFSYSRQRVQLFQGHITAHVQRTVNAKQKKSG
ncbi:uncharacterized protein LOC108654796 [Drosophila navojoa]|nr:uncharacterized protein LOC108654796 [Drosophila navojoa]